MHRGKKIRYAGWITAYGIWTVACGFVAFYGFWTAIDTTCSGLRGNTAGVAAVVIAALLWAVPTLVWVARTRQPAAFAGLIVVSVVGAVLTLRTYFDPGQLCW